MFYELPLLIIFFCLGSSIIDSVFYIFYIYITKKLLNFAYFIYFSFIRERKNLKAEYGNNTWALVTGSTDGIGKAFAEELAKSGFNIILVSRTKEKLRKVATEIRDLNPDVKVTIVPFDFGEKTTSSEYIDAFSEVIKYDVSILVNNVGVTMKDKFENLTYEETNNYIDLNVIPQTFLTNMFLNKMLNREKKSAIINLSSQASNIAAPNRFSLYGSTKIFNDYLSKGLGEAYNNKIDFLSVKPMMTESLQTNYKANDVFVVTAAQCVNGSLNALGYEEGTYGHWKHTVLANILLMIPEGLYLFFSNFAVSIMKMNKTK